MMPKISPIGHTALATQSKPAQQEQSKENLQRAPVWCRPSTLRRSSQNSSHNSRVLEKVNYAYLHSREYLGLFIVVESRLFLLGVQVFSIWDSASSNPKCDGQVFPCGVDFLLRQIFQNPLLCEHPDPPRVFSDFERVYPIF